MVTTLTRRPRTNAVTSSTLARPAPLYDVNAPMAPTTTWTCTFATFFGTFLLALENRDRAPIFQPLVAQPDLLHRSIARNCTMAITQPPTAQEISGLASVEPHSHANVQWDSCTTTSLTIASSRTWFRNVAEIELQQLPRSIRLLPRLLADSSAISYPMAITPIPPPNAAPFTTPAPTA